jgi:Kef-type K+ transport system membrane component KefB
MALDLKDIFGYWNILAGCVVIAVFGKLLSSFLITKMQKCERQMSLFIGFITIPRGEFSLVISEIAGSSIAFINPVLVFTVLLTTLLSSLVLRFTKFLCSAYNVCIIYPRSRISGTEDWGEID